MLLTVQREIIVSDTLRWWTLPLRILVHIICVFDQRKLYYGRDASAPGHEHSQDRFQSNQTGYCM